MRVKENPSWVIGPLITIGLTVIGGILGANFLSDLKTKIFGDPKERAFRDYLKSLLNPPYPKVLGVINKINPSKFQLLLNSLNKLKKGLGILTERNRYIVVVDKKGEFVYLCGEAGDLVRIFAISKNRVDFDACFNILEQAYRASPLLPEEQKEKSWFDDKEYERWKYNLRKAKWDLEHKEGAEVMPITLAPIPTWKAKDTIFAGLFLIGLVYLALKIRKKLY